MASTTVTLSSVGVSDAIALNWRGGGPTACVATLGSTTMTVDFIIQYAVDDLQLSSSPNWRGFSSGVVSGYSTSPATHYTSASADSGVFFAASFPISAVRLNSTAISSSTLTLKALQGEAW